MTIIEIINSVLAGGLLGALGQGIRIAVGLKKLNEENSVRAVTATEEKPFSTSRLVISIFIGFVAGALAILVKQSTRESGAEVSYQLDNEMIIALIATGYAGADFIEGIFITYSSKFNPPATPPTAQPVKDDSLQADIVG